MAWEDRPYNRSDDEPPRIRLAVPMPHRMTMTVMGVCLAMFFVVNVFGFRGVAESLYLTYSGGTGLTQPWRLLTYAYLHAGGSHIFFNLLTLYFFLSPLEARWGWKRAFAFYTGGTLAAAATFGLMCVFFPFAGLVGASGGALAAIGACAYLFPEMSFFGVIPIRVGAALIGVLYLLTIAGDKDASDAAHLGGLVFGFFGPYYLKHSFTGLADRYQQYRARREVMVEHDEQATIDRILEKVHHQGMNSLSRSERNTLKRATERQRQQDLARARRRA